MIDGVKFASAIHYGPRPVFKDSPAFEVHLLDQAPASTPEEASVELVKRLRDVSDFGSTGDLLKQIEQDIEETRAVLGLAR